MNFITIKDINEFKTIRQKLEQDIGFVPTMGNLHAGHLSLIEKSLNNHEVTVVSIFVNPLQFGPNEDFAEYPRTLKADCELIAKLIPEYPGKKIIILTPDDTLGIYPPHFKTHIEVTDLSNILCGKNRPGHFRGVTTVVYKLLNTVRPATLYLGQKDYQQVCIIKKMVADLEIPVDIFMGPTVRDSNGLALSSRNQYLSEEEYRKALILPASLHKIKNNITKGQKIISEILKNDPSFDYLELRDADTIDAINSTTQKALIVGAYRVGKTRLIDNEIIDWKIINE